MYKKASANGEALGLVKHWLASVQARFTRSRIFSTPGKQVSRATATGKHWNSYNFPSYVSSTFFLLLFLFSFLLRFRQANLLCLQIANSDPCHSSLVKTVGKKKHTHVPHSALDYDTKWKLGVCWLAKACVILELIRHSSCSKASTRTWLAQPSLSIRWYKKIARIMSLKNKIFSIFYVNTT